MATVAAPSFLHHFTQQTTAQHEAQSTSRIAPDIPYIPRGQISANLTFYSPPTDGSAPWNYVESPPPGLPQRNYTQDTRPVLLSDARGHEHDYSTDTSGFALLAVPPSKPDIVWSDPASVEAEYYPEVSRLLLDHLSAERVLLFDHTVRLSSPNATRGPVARAHVDQTPRAAVERVRRHAGPDAERLLAGRVRIVNVWRPLNGPVVRDPLAMAESDSVGDGEVVGIEHRYPDRTGETAGVKIGEGQRWVYWSGMGNEERILLQCYDSAGGKRVPHCAFTDERTEGEGWRGRESIEVRALVFG